MLFVRAYIGFFGSLLLDFRGYSYEFVLSRTEALATLYTSKILFAHFMPYDSSLEISHLVQFE